MTSLRARLSWYLIGGMALVLLVAGLALSLAIVAWMTHGFDQALEAKAMALVTLTEQEDGVVEMDFADEFMPEFEAADHPEYFELWLRGGTLVERSRSFEASDTTRAARLPRSEEVASEPRFRDVRLPDGRAGRQVQIDFVPQVDVEEGEEGEEGPGIMNDPTESAAQPGLEAATLIVARERERLDARIALVRATLGAVALGLLVALGVLTRVTVRVGLRPLEGLAREVRRLDAQSLDSRVAVEGVPEEIAPVVEQLNALLGRLEAAFKRERQLSHDVAHELKTPIAELRSLCEVGGRWPEDRAAVRQFFEDARAIALQMERIVSHLLALARYDEGREPVWRTRVRVAEVIESAWKHLAREAGAKRLEFRQEVPASLQAETDLEKFHLIVSNLLSNAVAYSPPGTTILCRSAEQNGKVSVSVINRAENLAAEDVPVMFDRFWRKEEARTGGRNVGLGLSLVKAFADLLGIEVEAALGPDQTFRISLSVPDAGPVRSVSAPRQ